MNDALPILMFLAGFAAGGGILWLLFKNSVAAARQQERNQGLADVRVAEERAAAKETTLGELRADISAKNHLLDQRGEEIVQLKEQHAVLQTSLCKEQEKIQEKIDLLGEAEKQLKEAFKALASDALKENNKEFDKLANPVKQVLGQINEKIAVVNDSATNLGAQTSKLVKALQRPEVRGQWGEMALERALELAGMSEGRDFDRQQVIGEESAKQRPDIVVHLPGGKHLAVDAKAPIDAFLDAVDEADEDARETKLKEFGAHVRKRIKELGGKSYQNTLPDSLEFVLLYLPSEAVYRSALELEADLVEYSYGQRVFLVGPTNLMAVLLVVAEGWKQEAVTKNLADIRGHAEELYKRLKVFIGHVSDIGCHLDKSREAYNSAIGSFESRLMPHARRIEQLEAAPTDVRIEEPAPIETPLRQIRSADFTLEQPDRELEEADSHAWPR